MRIVRELCKNDGDNTHAVCALTIEITLEPHLDTCLTTHYLESWYVIDPFLQCMMHCITFITILRNFNWNMCANINWPTLTKHNILSCTSASIWTVLIYGIIKHHQMLLIINAGMYLDFR